jgi:hypothetical protein
VEVVLVDDSVWSLDDVERIERDAALLAERVEVLRALRKRMRNGNLIIKVNTNVRMSRKIGRNVLEYARSRFLRSHAGGWESNAGYRCCTRKQIVIVMPDERQ